MTTWSVNGSHAGWCRGLGRFCGTDYPAGISCSWHISVEPSNFVSDLSVTSDGFMVFYTSVPRGSQAPSTGGDIIHSSHTGARPTPKPTRPTPKPRPGAVRPKPTRRPTAKPRPSPRTPAGRPATKPNAKPKVAKPSAKPKVAKPSPKPKAVKPSAKPKVAKPIAKPKVAKPTAKPKTLKPGVKSTAKPWLKLKPKATPRPKFSKFNKPTPKPKSPAKPAKADAKVKPTGKPLAKPARPTRKAAVRPGVRPVVKPTMPPKVKPRVPAKPGQGKATTTMTTTTKKPFLIKKPMPTANPQCNQACERTGTLQSNFCPHDFVITGRVTSLTPGARGSAVAEVSLIKAYKTGSLKVLKAGPMASVTLSATCRKCPALQKGVNYVLMGAVDSQGNGLLTPSSFTLLYKPMHAKALANYAQQPC
ncbi:hypothetical protein CRUP_024077 [Coryphaenoides rupestris]|nr:hypothetical protein CRUP_024077 [Coryphaenoides rupestris]